MTDLLQHERQPHPDDRYSPSSLTIGTQPVGSRIASSVLRCLPRCFSFLGYTVVVVVLVAALLELASWAIWSVHPLTRQAELENQGASPVYAGVDWAREFWQEESLRRKKPTVYVPFRIWSVTNWHGKYINNDQGVRGAWRRTINPANCVAPHSVSVWIFGGSTMYGTAVPDWATIPSYLSRDLNAGSRDCVVVSNFGVEGYVTDQELILLAEQLKAGGDPDIVIFYDGVNDSSLAWPPSSSPNPHFLFRTIKTRVEGSLSGRLDFLQTSYAMRLAREGLASLRPARSFPPLISEAQPNVVTTLDNYEANLRLVRALGEAYKFKLYCFWQPMLIYGHKPLVPFEQQMATRDASGISAESAWFLTIAAAYREAERRAARNGNFVFLGSLFDSTGEPIYVDEAHLGPRGNELAAQAIARYIQDYPGH
jgi:lysophospholipase L1-like esterase